MDIADPEVEQQPRTATPAFVGSDRYRIHSTLGAGGMGIVYLAEDLKLHRQVAIKKLKDDAASQNARDRIQQEARLLAKLNHPNIVALHDVLEDQGDIALVMEYIEGTTLRAWMRERTPNLQQKLSLLMQICQGLQQAHDLGIIHRDLKPDNILIAENAKGQPTAKITDFGIAKSQALDEETLTAENQLAGTITAMSPEQIQGKTLDARSDLFSLGTIAFELLCGSRPFAKHEAGALAMANRITSEPHIPPQQANPRLLDPLCHLIDNLLSKNANERPDSAAQVFEAIDFLHNQYNSDDTQEFSKTITQILQKQTQNKYRKLISLAIIPLFIVCSTLAFYISPTKSRAEEIIAIVPPNLYGESLSENNRKKIESAIIDAIQDNIFIRKDLFLANSNLADGINFENHTSYLKASGATQLVQPEALCESQTCNFKIRFINNRGLIRGETQQKLNLKDNEDLRSIVNASFARAFPNSSGDIPTNSVLSEHDQSTYFSIFHSIYVEANPTNQEIYQLKELVATYPRTQKLYHMLIDGLITKYELEKNIAHLDEARKVLSRAESTFEDRTQIPKMWARLAIFDARVDFNEQLNSLSLTHEPKQNIAYIKARKFLNDGDIEKALTSINHYLIYSRDTKALQLKAELLMRKGDYENSRNTLQELLALAPNDYKALNLLGPVALFSGKPYIAKTTFERLLEKADSFYIRNNLGITYLLTGEYIKSQHAFERALQYSPENAEAMINLADLENSYFDPESARGLYKKYLSIYGTYEDLQNLIFQSQAHAALGDKLNAVRALQAATRKAGNDPFVIYNLALTQLRLEDDTASLVSIESALERGLSPVWLKIPAFSEICEREVFSELINRLNINCNQPKKRA